MSLVAGPFIVSPHHHRVRASCRSKGPAAVWHASEPALGTHALAAGADNGLDELAIRVLVSAAQEFDNWLVPVRAIVEPSGEIEGTDGVVGGSDREQSRRGGQRGRDVTDDSRLGGLEIFP